MDERVLTPDGRWEWHADGWRLRSTSLLGPDQWSLPVVLRHLIWLGLLSAGPLTAIVFAAGLGPGGEMQGGQLWALAAMGCLGVVATIWFGAWLTVARRWPQLLLAPVLGTGALLACYVLAFALLQSNDAQADNAAGAGIVTLAVPTFVIVSALLGAGAGSVLAVRRLKRTAL